jgi:hypothetical protein
MISPNEQVTAPTNMKSLTLQIITRLSSVFTFFAIQAGRISTTDRAGMIRVRLWSRWKARRSSGNHAPNAPGRALISSSLSDSIPASCCRIRVEREPSRVQVQLLRFTQFESACTAKAISRCRSSKFKCVGKSRKSVQVQRVIH